MAGNRMGEQTRERILAAAEQEFIEHGFENSKMDGIAARAGITRVMLFYHFSNKQNLLNEIIKKVVNEISTKFHSQFQPEDKRNPAMFQDHLNTMLEYYHNRQNVIRLILAEYIMNQREESLSAFSEFFKQLLSFSDKDPGDDQEEFLIKIFFFNALPMLMYSTLGDSFSRDFHISPEKANRTFIQNFMVTFMANSRSINS